jgi:hypothetical protein
VPLSQNARFSAIIPDDPEFDHPPGAWLARHLQRDLAARGWTTNEFDNWRDCGWFVRCVRGQADLELCFSAVACDWLLQVAPTGAGGLLGRRRPTATPEDCHSLATAVHACLREAGMCTSIRWGWDGDPDDVASSDSPTAPAR